MLDMTNPSELRLLARATIGFVRYPYAAEMLRESGTDAWQVVLEHGPAEDKEMLGPLLEAMHSWSQLKNAIWAAKLRGFLRELLQASTFERAALEEKVGAVGSELEWTGEAVLMLLDSLDDAANARILGRLFRAYLGGDLDRHEFLRVARKAGRASFLDLIALRGFPGHVPAVSVCEDLEHAGLLRLKSRANAPVSGEDFEASVHGKILIRMMSDMEALSVEV